MASFWNTSTGINTTTNSVCSSADGSVMYAVFDSLYTSTDGGQTWLTGYYFEMVMTGIFCTSDGVNIIVISRFNDAVFFSTNSGSSFNFSTSSYTSCAVNTNGGVVYGIVADGSNVLSTTDGSSYSSYISEVGAVNIASGSEVTTTTGYFYYTTSGNDLYVLRNGYTDTPVLITGGLSAENIICNRNGTTAVAVTQNTLYCTTDAFQTFEPLILPGNIQAYTGVLFNDDLSLIFVSIFDTPSGIYVINNLGEPVITTGNTGNTYSLAGSTNLSNIIGSVEGGSNNPIYATNLVCYFKGSLIETETCYVKIEDLRIGDSILTYGKIINDKEHEFISESRQEKIKWIGKVKEIVNEDIYPIVYQNLKVSQKHRVIYENKFICVNQIPGTYIDRNHREIEYYHLETENHSIIKVNDIYTETLNDNPSRKYLFSPL